VNAKGVKPIQSHYPGQRMVLDLMDFTVSKVSCCVKEKKLIEIA